MTPPAVHARVDQDVLFEVAYAIGAAGLADPAALSAVLVAAARLRHPTAVVTIDVPAADWPHP